MSEHGTLSPEELAELFRRLDMLIDEARTLQRQITERILSSRRRDQPDRSGQPGATKSPDETRRNDKREGLERRRKPRAK
jgi:hypothetical protein